MNDRLVGTSLPVFVNEEVVMRSVHVCVLLCESERWSVVGARHDILLASGA